MNVCSLMDTIVDTYRMCKHVSLLRDFLWHIFVKSIFVQPTSLNKVYEMKFQSFRLMLLNQYDIKPNLD